MVFIEKKLFQGLGHKKTGFTFDFLMNMGSQLSLDTFIF